jgi:hypothetical protein
MERQMRKCVNFFFPSQSHKSALGGKDDECLALSFATCIERERQREGVFSYLLLGLEHPLALAVFPAAAGVKCGRLLMESERALPRQKQSSILIRRAADDLLMRERRSSLPPRRDRREKWTSFAAPLSPKGKEK